MSRKRLFLNVLMFLLLFSTKAQDSVAVDTIIINAQQKPVVLDKEYKIMRVITREQIEALSPVSFADLLDKLSSAVDLKFRGSGDVQADISLNGSGFNDVLILINGVKVADYQTGHFTLNLPISLQMIQRVEILQGPDARKYGLGAYAGAVNIITGMKGRNKFSTSVGLYEQSKKPIVSAAFLSKDLIGTHGLIGAHVKQSGGYTENTDFDVMKFFYTDRWSIGHARVFVQAGILKQKFGALNFYTPRYPYQYEENNQQFLSMAARFKNNWRLVGTWRRQQDKFELFREGKNWYEYDGHYFIRQGDTAQFAPGMYYTGHNYHANNTVDVELSRRVTTKLGNTYFQAELINTWVNSTVLGDSLPHPINIPFERGKIFTLGAHRTNFVLGLDHIYQGQRVSISAGVTMLYNNYFGWIPGMGLDLGCNLHNNFRLFVGVNQSMRLPTFTEMYYHDPVHLASYNLRPEKSLGYQAGVNWHSNRATVQLAPFYVRYFGKIDWVWDKASQVYISQNITDYDAYGFNVSTSLKLNLGPLKNAFVAYSFMNYRGFNFPQSKYTDNLTHQRLSAYLDFVLWHRGKRMLLLTYNLVYKQRFVTVINKDVRNVFLNDLSFSLISSNLDISCKVENFSNQVWYDYYTPMPGRTYFLTLNFKF